MAFRLASNGRSILISWRVKIRGADGRRIGFILVFFPWIEIPASTAFSFQPKESLTSNMDKREVSSVGSLLRTIEVVSISRKISLVGSCLCQEEDFQSLCKKANSWF